MPVNNITPRHKMQRLHLQSFANETMNTNVNPSSDESGRRWRSCGTQLKPPHTFSVLGCDVM